MDIHKQISLVAKQRDTLLAAVKFARKRLGFDGQTLPIGSDLELMKTLNEAIKIGESKLEKLA